MTTIRHRTTWPTNFNGKLHCQSFIHIVKGGNPLSQTVLEQMVVEISTADGSHPTVEATIEDIARRPLNELPGLLTWCSHGMDSRTFVQWMISEHPELEPTSEVAVYFYKRKALL